MLAKHRKQAAQCVHIGVALCAARCCPGWLTGKVNAKGLVDALAGFLRRQPVETGLDLADSQRRLQIFSGEQLDSPPLPVHKHGRDRTAACLELGMIARNAVSLPEAFQSQTSTGSDEIAVKSLGQERFVPGHVILDIFLGETVKRFGAGQAVVLRFPAFGAPAEIDTALLGFGHADNVVDRHTLGSQVQVADSKAKELGRAAGQFAGIKDRRQRVIGELAGGNNTSEP